ncbi:GNAT family N-acetyltransferase [Streptomyces spiramenti]|uniref:N-acetyltransferase n=1 Tax=Streptomyces spiramenti TaxID=2720606 RepID=A0ABX1APH5_9ACTN|nr:N-acetyltransferase [Streptomyces spiramenti]NJP66170.1 N-acetyltransferase [Streptomyces spiramenti]
MASDSTTPNDPEQPFVPGDFTIPGALVTDRFRLEPLSTDHNEADLAAWSGSIEHIRATPGFADRDWPTEGMTPEENHEDLRQHAEDFERRVGFTYTVLQPDQGETDDGDVLGCVYIYPADADDEKHDASVRSWVRAERAELDLPLYESVLSWLSEEWPFRSPRYAER